MHHFTNEKSAYSALSSKSFIASTESPVLSATKNFSSNTSAASSSNNSFVSNKSSDSSNSIKLKEISMNMYS